MFVCLNHLTRLSQLEDFIKLVSVEASRRMSKSESFAKIVTSKSAQRNKISLTLWPWNLIFNSSTSFM